ncbi:ClpP/crotonase-like domain-containing protein [Helicostylum pulchrum]|nr:ClpP/crotonase-like domain-containing protein [Helicostylum pulchrum]
MTKSTSKTISVVQDRLLTQLSFLKGDSDEEPPILTESVNNVRIMLLNRPKQLNAFSYYMVDTMLIHFKEWEKLESVDMIILKGQGGVFGAGADIKDIAQMITIPSKKECFNRYLDIFYDSFHFVATAQTPIISFMDGIAVGSAGSYGTLSHFSIATENTKMFMPETRLGHFCDAGASFYLSRLNDNMGKYIALTSQTIEAEDVLFSGLATHFVLSSQLPSLQDSLIGLKILSLDIINETIESFAVKASHVPKNYTLHGEKRETIDRCFQFDTVTEIIEALRKEGSIFSLETIKQIFKGSPVSVALTLEQMRRGSKLPLSQCLFREHKSWHVSKNEPDIHEGISSVIHKKPPRWPRLSYANVDFKTDILEKYIDADVERALKVTSDKKDCYFTTQGRKFGLPTKEEVRQAKHENNLHSDESVIAWFINHRNNKYGIREEVKEILVREKNIV